MFFSPLSYMQHVLIFVIIKKCFPYSVSVFFYFIVLHARLFFSKPHRKVWYILLGRLSCNIQWCSCTHPGPWSETAPLCPASSPCIQSLWWGDYPVKCLSLRHGGGHSVSPQPVLPGPAHSRPSPALLLFTARAPSRNQKPICPAALPPSKNDFSGFVAVRPKDIMSWNQCQ